MVLGWLRAAAQAGAESGRATGDAGRRTGRAADSMWSDKQERGADKGRQCTPRAAACSTGPKPEVTQSQPRPGTPGDRDREGWPKGDDGMGRDGSTGVASEALFGCLKAGRMTSRCH